MKTWLKKVKVQKINFLILFIIFGSFSVSLFQRSMINVIVLLYFLFGASLIDICFHVKQNKSETIRAKIWIILNALIGVVLMLNSLFNDMEINKYVFIILAFWIVFITIFNYHIIKN